MEMILPATPPPAKPAAQREKPEPERAADKKSFSDIFNQASGGRKSDAREAKAAEARTTEEGSSGETQEAADHG